MDGASMIVKCGRAIAAPPVCAETNLGSFFHTFNSTAGCPLWVRKRLPRRWRIVVKGTIMKRLRASQRIQAFVQHVPPALVFGTSPVVGDGHEPLDGDNGTDALPYAGGSHGAGRHNRLRGIAIVPTLTGAIVSCLSLLPTTTPPLFSSRSARFLRLAVANQARWLPNTDAAGRRRS